MTWSERWPPPRIDYLSPDSAARRLFISTRRVYELAERDELPMLRHSMVDLIPVEAIERLEEDLRVLDH